MVNIGHKSQLNRNDNMRFTALFSNKKTIVFFISLSEITHILIFIFIETDFRANEWAILSVR